MQNKLCCSEGVVVAAEIDFLWNSLLFCELMNLMRNKSAADWLILTTCMQSDDIEVCKLMAGH